MLTTRPVLIAAVLIIPAAGAVVAQAPEEPAGATKVLVGQAAFGDWRENAPGVVRLIRPRDLPSPYATSSAHNGVRIAGQPRQGELRVPAGFAIRLFASGLRAPRLMRVAPNGDVFVAESEGNRISVLRPVKNGGRPERETFASSLHYPFGIAFYPQGDNPQWVYVAETSAVVRFPYRNGDRKSRGKAETVVPRLPSGGEHVTRDVVFSKDGARMFVSVGSATNDGEDMRKLDPQRLEQWTKDHALGAAWGNERNRADVLVFTPEGKDEKVYAAGIRNCVGMAIQPSTGDLWCSVNERDGLGDNLPPDYITRVREGAFYGWPWYYIGSHQDPRHKGEREDLKGKVKVPDVLIQAHSASMQMVFYDGNQFPAAYRDDAFAAEHGSWNRHKRTGYKVVRVLMKDGKPTGEYEDFITGFVINDEHAWGRPVGVAVMHDGSLLVSDDANGTIWRVTCEGKG